MVRFDIRLGPARRARLSPARLSAKSETLQPACGRTCTRSGHSISPGPPMTVTRSTCRPRCRPWPTGHGRICTLCRCLARLLGMRTRIRGVGEIAFAMFAGISCALDRRMSAVPDCPIGSREYMTVRMWSWGSQPLLADRALGGSGQPPPAVDRRDITFTTRPLGSVTKKGRTPQASSVSGLVIGSPRLTASACAASTSATSTVRFGATEADSSVFKTLI